MIRAWSLGRTRIVFFSIKQKSYSKTLDDGSTLQSLVFFSLFPRVYHINVQLPSLRQTSLIRVGVTQQCVHQTVWEELLFHTRELQFEIVIVASCEISIVVGCEVVVASIVAV
jgi:hypothetical protein